MVRRCGFCREEGHDRRRCQGWIQHEQREADQNYHTIRLGINPPIINQTIIDLSDDYAEISPRSPLGSPPGSPPRSPRTPPNAPLRIQAHPRPAHRPTSFPNTGGQGRVSRIIHIRAVGTNLEDRFEEVADSITNTPVGMRSNTQISPELVNLSNKVIEATTCAICIEELGKTNKLVTRCGHQFCCGCMFIHMRSNNFCPSCRGILA